VRIPSDASDRSAPSRVPTSRVDVIVGARPNFMKVAPIIAEVVRRRSLGGIVRHRLVHTGQHYDHMMSGGFFDQLGIPTPDVNLEVGSGTQAEQSAGIMIGYERLLLRERSDLCLVVGDVNSTMACAITAKKCGLPVAHVEAGIRSGDWGMPEEVNRVVTDSVADMFFTTSELAGRNLEQCGAESSRIYFVGNTMIDTLLANIDRLRPPHFWKAEALHPGRYFVLTLHRPSNVDSTEGLTALLEAVAIAARGEPVVFPVHPRTAKALKGLAGLPRQIRAVEPQPYLEFNFLVKHARAVITDSGGVTEEATVMGVPCMTLRTTTERPETVTIGTNELLGVDPAALRPAAERLFAGEWKRGGIPPRWDGQAGRRIVDALEHRLGTA
jgi:UDP-N-acetylglucosamine 2-epimerase (non-hydrolysing)